jgi:hypothetical protein
MGKINWLQYDTKTESKTIVRLQEAMFPQLILVPPLFLEIYYG